MQKGHVISTMSELYVAPTPTTDMHTYIPTDGVEYLEGCFGLNDITALSQPLHGLVEGGDVPHQP